MVKSVFTKDYKVFLEMLKEVRQRSGVTQVELAEKLGITQSLISKYERGETRLDVIQVRAICQALGTSLPAFMRRLEKRLSE